MLNINLKEKAKKLKSEIAVLTIAFKDPELPLLPKILLWVTLGYALSPIDLIPDFIPVLGYLDDIIILPILISLTISTIPKYIYLKAREQSTTSTPTPVSRIAPIVIVVLWLVITGKIIKVIVTAFK